MPKAARDVVRAAIDWYLAIRYGAPPGAIADRRDALMRAVEFFLGGEGAS